VADEAWLEFMKNIIPTFGGFPNHEPKIGMALLGYTHIMHFGYSRLGRKGLVIGEKLRGSEVHRKWRID